MPCLYVVDYSLALAQKSLLFNHCFSHLPQDARGLAGCTTHYHPAAALKTHFSPKTQLASWPALLCWAWKYQTWIFREKLEWNPVGIMRVGSMLVLLHFPFPSHPLSELVQEQALIIAD